MRRTGIVLSLILILSMVFAPLCYAAELSVVNVSPSDGEGGKQPQNMAVKLTFSESITDEGSIERNGKLFSVTDPEGNEFAYEAVCSAEKYPNEIWVVLTEDLASNTEYTFTAKAGITADSGNSLPADFVSTFRTRNTATDNTISMVLMVGMMALMVFASIRSARKQEAKNAMELSDKLAQDAKNLSPYKLSKEKGISIEEATRLVEKERAKIEKRRAKIDLELAKREKAKAEEIAKAEQLLREAEEAARKANNYRVKRKQSMKDHELEIPESVKKHIRKKKQAAEKAAKEAARAEADKANRNKKKRK